jgi:hypothetical protein
MSDEPQEPQGGAEEATPPKIRAEDNPWYLLATLYGEPGPKDLELLDKSQRLESLPCLVSQSARA